ncbi:hypothetical protein DICVIV_03494 [Dictyocaulus viviparus]|uniref:Uncharacterized protein n=1 Tax=Dictyocaulus viviparus TaxID=29172 RepID=A0A0D8Y710_DICVI|nr:hypothetical protein DICVIV_03494 [Dictyocaulus viviparus]
MQKDPSSSNFVATQKYEHISSGSQSTENSKFKNVIITWTSVAFSSCFLLLNQFSLNSPFCIDLKADDAIRRERGRIGGRKKLEQVRPKCLKYYEISINPKTPVVVAQILTSSSMSSSLLTASPSASVVPSSNKQAPFDDACFKTPLPFNRKPRRGRGAASTANATRLNGYHSSGTTRGGRVGRPCGTGRTAAPAPPPPSPKFVLHDVICPHTAAYLGALNLPMYASVQSNYKVKEEVVECDDEKPSTSTNQGKQEAIGDNPGSNLKLTELENGEPEIQKTESSEESNENGAETAISSNQESKESVKNTNDDSPDKLPFVEEMILDEYSLLLFTRLSDAQLYVGYRLRSVEDDRRSTCSGCQAW